MKKIILSIFCVISVIACSSNDNLDEINNDSNQIIENTTDFKYTVKEKNGTNNLIFTQEYSFDDDGKVMSEKYTNFNNPQFNHYSTFEYNKKGQVIKEIRDGQTQFNIIWTNDYAEVFNSQNQKISEFEFINGKLTKYKTEFNNNNVRTRKVNYDVNQNIVSIENEEGVFVEFLEYDITKLNPLNLIKSIGILRIDYKPYFKNIFGIEKQYPFEDDDYNFPLTFYDYNYEFDS